MECKVVLAPVSTGAGSPFEDSVPISTWSLCCNRHGGPGTILNGTAEQTNLWRLACSWRPEDLRPCHAEYHMGLRPTNAHESLSFRSRKRGRGIWSL